MLPGGESTFLYMKCAHEVCPQLHDFLNGDEFLEYLETTEI